MQRLFVYGTLAPGRANHHVLSDVPGTWLQATLRGTLHEEGWGATMGYPAIKLDDSADEVAGYVFQSDNLDASWPELDEFEGEEYLRVSTPVTLENGDVVEAWVYTLHPSKC